MKTSMLAEGGSDRVTPMLVSSNFTQSAAAMIYSGAAAGRWRRAGEREDQTTICFPKQIEDDACRDTLALQRSSAAARSLRRAAIRLRNEMRGIPDMAKRPHIHN